MTKPKAFISYSWSSDEHKEWVKKLATELRESGVDAILDVWELNKGNDVAAFMETAVSEPTIEKVIMVSDRMYVEKANHRSGGVGVETQIISEKVYRDIGQSKFVAVIAERDYEGRPCVPIYYSSKVYIDMSDDDLYDDGFEQLMRWIFDKPLDVKPEIGEPPAYITEENLVSLGTTASYKRALNAVRTNKDTAEGAIGEYLGILSRNLERLRISKKGAESKDGPNLYFDEYVIDSIEAFQSYRDEYVKLLTAIMRYRSTEENVHQLYKFLESIIHYTDRYEGIKEHFDTDFDNFRYIVYEVFLYTIAVLIKCERFEFATYLLEQYYHVPSFSYWGMPTKYTFSTFWPRIKSFEIQQQRVKNESLSLTADLLKDGCVGLDIEFRDLQQADFVLFMRSEVLGGGIDVLWQAETLAFFNFHQPPFEIFDRASSKKYFEKIKGMCAVDKVSDFDKVIQRYESGKRHYPNHRIRLVDLLGYKDLATLPKEGPAMAF